MADAGMKNPKPDLKSRQPRKKSGGILGKLLFVALLAALIGVGVVYRTQIVAFVNSLQKKEEPKVVVKEAPKPVEKRKEVVDAAPPVIPAKPQQPQQEKNAAAVVIPPKAAMPTGEEDVAKKLIADGRTALESFDFKKASELFQQASEKKAGSVKAEAATWVKKAAAFENATNHIPVAEYASAETTYILTTTDDRILSGLKIGEDAQTIRFQNVPPHNPASTGKTILPVGKPDVKNIVEVSKKQRRDEFMQLLGQLESGVVIARSTDYYDLVYISKRLGLGRECIEYLNRAYTGGPDHAPDPFLGDSFRKEVVRRSIDQCSMMLAAGRAKRFVQDELNKLQKTLPTYQLAQDEIEAFKVSVLTKFRDDFKSTLKEVKKAPPPPAVAAKVNKPAPQVSAKELVTEDQITEVVIDDSGVKGKGAAAPVVDQANQLYDEGMKLYRGYKQGSNSGNNQALDGAMKKLQAAIDLYDKALQIDGSNKAIMDRQLEASTAIYGCRKYKTL
jgi:tetratricopeptide (TPR) repeat protein